MSDTLAHYSFIPWLKQGIGTKITETDALGAVEADAALERAELAVGVAVQSTDVADASTIDTVVNKNLKMLGPPDILAISDQVIVRVEPKPKVNNFEANGLPYIEFFKENFLWMYSPAVAGTGTNLGKLTPWLTLICLKDDEFQLKQNTDGRPFITIPSDKIAEVFHENTQHWAWAHVHMNTELQATDLEGKIAEVTSELADNPDSGVCRLLCPRKLIKETQYTAFVVPSYETGRRAGMGLDFTGVAAQKMSWGHEAVTDYPVYYQWTFRTGQFGDFESLARILEPVVTDPELGKRDMSITQAGYGLDGITPDSETLGLEGALKPPDFQSDPWTDGAGDEAYREHLRKLLNLSIDHEKQQTDNTAILADSLAQNPFYSASLGEDPIVTPHIYGRWHALVDRLQSTNNFDWVNTLNLDPRNRATAGLGVKIVQDSQEDYMRRAWKQVEQINEANERIRKACFSRLVSKAMYLKHIVSADPDNALRLTGPMHKFILESGKTVENKLTKSLIPNASKSGAFRKIIRPGKKSNKKINALATAGANLLHTSIIHQFNEETTTAAVEKTAPALTITLDQVTLAVTTSISNYEGNNKAMAQQAIFEVLLGETSFDNLNTTPKKNDLKTKIDNLTLSSLNTASRDLAKNLIDGIQSSTEGGVTSSHIIVVEKEAYQDVFDEETTAKTYENILISRETEGEAGVIQHATLIQDIQSFQTAFTGFHEDVVSNMMVIPKGAKLTDVTSFSKNISSALHPMELVTSRVASSITLRVFNPVSGVHEKTNLDKLRPIMAYPKIDDPMYTGLKELSQEYILPNIDKVPVNSITLLETNQAFIEAYMAGLNHEMSRELLWREFPSDLRGTYFRQFWDVSDNILETDREKKYDIKKMHLWEDDLGEHTPRVITNPSGSAYLILLIRGELLKKYPNTQVLAQKAVFKNPGNPQTPRKLADGTVNGNIQVPLFMAQLDPDIYLFGFDLDIDEAKGDSDDASKPGWFFVLRERPGQIRFGLDDWTPVNPGDPDFPNGDPSNWNDLSWEHFIDQATDLENYQLDAQHTFSATAGSENSPQAVWGKNSADLAYILYQNPVLFARHAQEMLPD